MTPQNKERAVAGRPETGWARARRLRAQRAVQTCVPAVESADGAPEPRAKENIVRGED
ncbi:hypothetical protein ACL02U_03425 [Streptomyces sp. MS06]|uniref:hypothetical protein n=1 Tax=Streptomyces sp. MS06 TaxID=3385974 RepID=UPI0039A309C6